MIDFVVPLGLLALVLLTGLGVLSAWRDADNWSIDRDGKKIRYRNWTELAAHSVMCGGLAIGLAAWMLT